MIVVYVPCKDEEQAKKISRKLLEKRLIVCANIIPVQSMYWWENKIQEENEHVIIAKTATRLFQEIVGMVKEMHTYKTPLIEQWNVDDVDKDYLDWLNKEVK